MTSTELKEALLNSEDVTCKLRTGEVIGGTLSAIIYRKSGGNIRVSAEVTDKCERTAYIVEPEKIERRKKFNHAEIEKE